MMPNLTVTGPPILAPFTHDRSAALYVHTADECLENGADLGDFDEAIQEFMEFLQQKVGQQGTQSFYERKTIEQIIEEQGLQPVRSEDMYPKEPIWESQEEFDTFWNLDADSIQG